MAEQARDLAIPNVENLRWAIYQSIDRIFFRFASALADRLAEATQGTEGAIRAALDRRKEYSGTIAPELQRLSNVMAELKEVRCLLEEH